MRIGLIELSAHSEVLDSLIRQTVDLGCRVTVYTNTFCAESSTAAFCAAIEWQICPPDLPYIEFIKKSRSSIGSHDHIFVITPVDALCDLVSDDRGMTPVYHCLVHNLNTFTQPDDSRPNAAITRLVLQGAASVVLPDLRLQNSKDPLRARAINIAYPQNPHTSFKRDKVRCCIPGRIYDGRDHAMVLSALELASPHLTRPLRVDFLGEHADEESKAAIDAAREAVVPTVELRDYSRYVPQGEFDQTLAETDFLILPISESLTRNGVTEMRGQTCITGNINDMVRFSLPALMPTFYPLSDHLSAMTARYSDVLSLSRLIVNWANTSEFNDRKQEAPTGLEAYRSECLSALSELLTRK